ncbi:MULTISPECIES: amino acid kinase family protein [Holospora]|uniref:Uridylate kinase n=2 Tax=Holospora TaxID=44747 RepID=A0A061JHB5_9PROT|nr:MULTISPECIES: uridylate kinase [Holospora]ETZ04623.1 uridylate kinase [Holospora undulata HU1]GAJ46062.1 uridylate kinase [Holospora elegans E1]
MFQPGERLLLKLSGEVLGRTSTGESGGIVPETLKSICLQIKKLSQYRWTIVVGGGNFFRGGNASWCHRSTADRIGMLATGMNGLALHEMLEHLGVPSCLLSCGVCSGIGEAYDPRVARFALSNEKVVICVGGSGIGHVTTDTTSVLRACEIDCSVILKGSSVEGVYDADPKYHKDARFLSCITYTQAIQNRWKVMDFTAFTLAQEFQKKICVFSILSPQSLLGLIDGTLRHTLISCG